MKNEKIIEAWNKLEPDEAAENEIFNAIIQKQNRKKRFKFKRVTVIAAIMGVALILGAAAAATYYEMVYVDMGGNIREIDFPYFGSGLVPYDPGSEEYKFEWELINGKNEKELIYLWREDKYSTGAPARITIDDYDELKDYLNTHGAERFSLPGYIPKGYEFKFAHVHIGLSDNSNYEEFEPVYYEEKFGNIYEKYLLPDNQTLAASVILYYYKGKSYIDCHIGFSTYSTIDDMPFYTPPPGSKTKKEPEILELPQFERVLMAPYKSFLDPLYIMAVKSLDEPVYIYTDSFISRTWRTRNEELGVIDDIIKYNEADFISYIIGSSAPYGISRGDFIKIAESIK